MFDFLDKIPYTLLILVAVIMLLAPFKPMPHVLEKLIMLKNGTLHRPIDIFDLLYHLAPLALLALAARVRYHDGGQQLVVPLAALPPTPGHRSPILCLDVWPRYPTRFAIEDGPFLQDSWPSDRRGTGHQRTHESALGDETASGDRHSIEQAEAHCSVGCRMVPGRADRTECRGESLIRNGADRIDGTA